MRCRISTAAAIAAALTTYAEAKEFPPFAEVSKGYEEVVSTTDGAKPLYSLWIKRDEQQLLAELPRGWQRQKHLFAATQSSGGIFAGLQGPATYGYWKRYDDRMALIAPEIDTRAKGETQAVDSVERLFTDRVVVDVPIVCMGPGGQPVIDFDELLVRNASSMLGPAARGFNARLATIEKAKAFPSNAEVEFRVPGPDGRFVAFHYSISDIPDSNGYQPREADERVGYFTTVYRNLGEYDQEKKWVRYIDRWRLEKRDPKLKLSPPKEPIVFYVEHTVPVRYRRWIRQGVEHWNEAFEAVGLDGAIEVHYQDKASGAHMEKDPEDVRYNFIRWLNNDISTAIGPHRAHPLTGQILDADVVLTDGWIRAYWGWFYEDMPDTAVESFDAETLAWLNENPEWDPRLLLASPERRAEIRERIASGDGATALDPALRHDHDLNAISEWVGGNAGCGSRFECLAAHGLAANMAFARTALETLDLVGLEPEGESEGDMLDGIPDWFVGPLVAELVCHEVGHTLGLRHNFKSSAIYTLEQINSEEIKGKKPLGGSVMDYLPPNFNLESGEIQGDFAMIGIGPYDKWAIEYGYTFDDPKKVLERVGEPELVYLTDDDTGGCDPLARRYDLSADPLDYAENQMRIVAHQRERLLEKYVKDGESWSKARRGYMSTLGMQTRMLSMMGNWIGGAHVNRARKGDVEGVTPIEVVDPEQQRAALAFVIANSFHDDAFGVTPELLLHLTVDKWSDSSPGDRGDSVWPVHDRIESIQQSALTMVLNPTTLRRVYDNELRTPEDEDALTLPELLDALADACYTELEEAPGKGEFDDRSPMISSLRRNLQSGMTDRLAALAAGSGGLPRAIRTLARLKLAEIEELVDAGLERSDRLDRYTAAHLADLKATIDRAFGRVEVKG